MCGSFRSCFLDTCQVLLLICCQALLRSQRVCTCFCDAKSSLGESPSSEAHSHGATTATHLMAANVSDSFVADKFSHCVWRLKIPSSGVAANVQGRKHYFAKDHRRVVDDDESCMISWTQAAVVSALLDRPSIQEGADYSSLGPNRRTELPCSAWKLLECWQANPLRISGRTGVRADPNTSCKL